MLRKIVLLLSTKSKLRWLEELVKHTYSTVQKSETTLGSVFMSGQNRHHVQIFQIQEKLMIN